MIPRGYIDAWREHAPWRSDAMVEQDLIICRSLAAIFSHPELSRLLAFRGGNRHRAVLLEAAIGFVGDGYFDEAGIP